MQRSLIFFMKRIGNMDDFIHPVFYPLAHKFFGSVSLEIDQICSRHHPILCHFFLLIYEFCRDLLYLLFFIPLELKDIQNTKESRCEDDRHNRQKRKLPRKWPAYFF